MKRRTYIQMLVAVVALTITGSSCQRRICILRRNYHKENLKIISYALLLYSDDHKGVLPASLSKLQKAYLAQQEALVHPRIPIVPGSKPPTSYHYISCEPDASPETIIVYPNYRGEGAPLCVLTYGGEIKELTPEEYEKAVRALGGDYDSLPEAK